MQTTSRSDQQSDSPLGVALAHLALAASDYYTCLMATEGGETLTWSCARSEVLAAALAVGKEVEQEVRQLADNRRVYPVTRTGDKARS